MIHPRRKALEDELYRLRYLAEEAESDAKYYRRLAHRVLCSEIEKSALDKTQRLQSEARGYRLRIATIQTQLDALPK